MWSEDYLDNTTVQSATAAIAGCDLFVSIGTSGNVYPAAGFVSEVRAAGRAHTLELNLGPSDGGRHPYRNRPRRPAPSEGSASCARAAPLLFGGRGLA